MGGGTRKGHSFSCWVGIRWAREVNPEGPWFTFMEAPRQAASRAEARTGKIKEDSNLREWDRVKVQIPRLLSIGWPGDDVARQ